MITVSNSDEIGVSTETHKRITKKEENHREKIDEKERENGRRKSERIADLLLEFWKNIPPLKIAQCIPSNLMTVIDFAQ